MILSGHRGGMTTTNWTIGIIGGSGLYALDALEDPQWIAIDLGCVFNQAPRSA